MAWEVYRKSLEWEEVQRVPIGESMPDQKPEISKEKPHVSKKPYVLPTKLANRFTTRKCTNLAHLLTLRSQGKRSTVCGECAQEITWEDLKSKK